MRGLGAGLLSVFSLAAAAGTGDDPVRVIDDRSTGDLRASAGGDWRLVTDEVMGGQSIGRVRPSMQEGRPCLKLTGDVSTARNGGFVQMALEIPEAVRVGMEAFAGLEIDVTGNGESYNLHLRTSDLWLPWQSYRQEFVAGPGWHTLRMPFDAFEGYRTGRPLRLDRLRRIGVVAIGRDFEADLCLGGLRIYREAAM